MKIKRKIINIVDYSEIIPNKDLDANLNFPCLYKEASREEGDIGLFITLVPQSIIITFSCLLC